MDGDGVGPALGVPHNAYNAELGTKMKRGFTTKQERRERNSDFSLANERWEKTRYSGFTLLETIITLAITVIALLALTNLFFVFNSIYGYQQAFMAAAGSSGAAINAFEAAVLPADQVLASHVFSGTTHTSSANTLVLELPAIDGSGNVIPSAKDYIVFYASSSNLYRLTQADALSARVSGLKKLSTTLQSLTFSYDNADFAKVTNVTTDIQTQAQFKQQAVQSHLQEQMYLRNMQPTP